MKKNKKIRLFHNILMHVIKMFNRGIRLWSVYIVKEEKFNVFKRRTRRIYNKKS